MVETSSKAFNYSFEMKWFPSYGEFINGSWTDMIGCIYSEHSPCDGMLFIGFEYAWSYGIDQCSLISVTELNFVTRIPEAGLKWYGFLQPFPFNLWIYVCLAFFFICGTNFVVMYYHVGGRFNRSVSDAGFMVP